MRWVDFVVENRRAAGAAVLVVCTLLAASFLLFYRLDAEPFQDYDEATYAEITHEALASHQYFSPTFLYNDYFRKPPLLFWINEAAASVAQPEFANRFSSAFSALLLIAFAIYIGRAVTGEWWVGLFGGLVLATIGAFIEPARQVRFDILITLFDLLAVYAFWKGLTYEKWFLWCGVFGGLAVLTKGPLVIYGVAAMIALAIAYKRINWIKSPYVWGGLGIAALVVLPWHIYMTIVHGMAFWQTYLGDQVIQRVGQTFFVDQPDNIGYLSYALSFGAPWAEMFVIVTMCMLFISKKATPAVRAWFWAMVAGVGAVLAIDFITKTKAFSYLIPLYPFLATAVSLGTYEIFRYLKPRERLVAGAVLAVCILVGGWWTMLNAFHLNGYYTAEVQLAQEEHTIGLYLKSHAKETFYDYNATNLGDIMFYSGMVQPIFLPSAVEPRKNGYILYPAGQLAELQQRYPTHAIEAVFVGKFLGIAHATR